MAVPLGQAVVEIVPDTKGFGKETEKEIEDALRGTGEKAGKQVGDGLSSAFKKIGTAVAAAGVGAFFKSTIDAAGDLNEQVSKTGVVFGDSADLVLEFGKNAAQSIGASEQEALTAAATFGNLLRSVGLTGDASARMSINMVQLAGDLASFNNVPVGDALEAIRSGLVGETEPLKKFGVNLNEATLRQEAMRLGLDTTGTTLDATSKAQAAYSIIMKQTALAQGDFARTSDSLANQQRIMAAEFQNAKADIGEALLPAMLSVVGAGRDLIPVLSTTASSFGSLVSAVAPVAGLLASIASSDIGGNLIVVGLGATAAYIAFDKLWKSAQAAQKAIQAASTGISTTNIVLAGIGLTLGIAAAAWTSYKAGQEEAAKSQEAFNKAVSASGDPLAKLGDEYERLSTATIALSTASGQVVQSLEDVVQVALTKRLNDNTNAMTGLGITFEDVNRAVLEGGDAYDQLDKKLYDAMNHTRLYGGETANLREDIKATKKEIEGNRDAIAEQITMGLNWLVLNGKLSTEELNHAREMTGTNDKTQQAIMLGQQYAGVLETESQNAGGMAKPLNDAAAATGNLVQAQTEEQKQAGALEAAHQRVADAMVKKNEAIADTAVQYGISFSSAAAYVTASDSEKAATERNKESKDALTKALDEASAAQDHYLFTISGAQVTEDQVTTSSRELTKTLGEGSEAAGRGTTAFEGNSAAAINNRKALDDVLRGAQDVVNGYDEMGYSSDEAKAKQATLAQSMYDTMIQAGATADEAGRVRDQILSIPPEKTAKVIAEAHNVDQTNADIDYAARQRTAIIALEASGQSIANLNEIRRQMGVPQQASGGVWPARQGGTLVNVGEGGQAEAIVPLGANFADNLARVVGPGMMAKLNRPQGQGTTSTTVNVKIDGAQLSDGASASRLGRIVGETAAQVLAHRQLATSVRVG